MKKPELPKDTDTYYYHLEPVYDHYKKVKVIDRCECCDHKIGEHLEERGIKIIEWKIVKAKKDMMWAMRQRCQEALENYILKPNPIVENLLKRK